MKAFFEEALSKQKTSYEQRINQMQTQHNDTIVEKVQNEQALAQARTEEALNMQKTTYEEQINQLRSQFDVLKTNHTGELQAKEKQLRESVRMETESTWQARMKELEEETQKQLQRTVEENKNGISKLHKELEEKGIQLS